MFKIDFGLQIVLKLIFKFVYDRKWDNIRLYNSMIWSIN